MLIHTGVVLIFSNYNKPVNNARQKNMSIQIMYYDYQVYCYVINRARNEVRF